MTNELYFTLQMREMLFLSILAIMMKFISQLLSCSALISDMISWKSESLDNITFNFIVYCGF